MPGEELTSGEFTGAGVIDMARCKDERALVCNVPTSTTWSKLNAQGIWVTLTEQERTTLRSELKIPGTPEVPVEAADICIPLTARVQHASNFPSTDISKNDNAPIVRHRSTWEYFPKPEAERATYLRLRLGSADLATKARSALAAQCAAAAAPAFSEHYRAGAAYTALRVPPAVAPLPGPPNPAVEEPALRTFPAVTMGLEYEFGAFHVGIVVPAHIVMTDEAIDAKCKEFRDNKVDRVFAVRRRHDPNPGAIPVLDVTKDEGSRKSRFCSHILELIYGPVALDNSGRAELGHQHSLRLMLLDTIRQAVGATTTRANPLSTVPIANPLSTIPIATIHASFRQALAADATLNPLYELSAIESAMQDGVFQYNKGKESPTTRPQLNRAVLLSSLRACPMPCRCAALVCRPVPRRAR